MRSKLFLFVTILMLITASFAFSQSWDQAKGIGLTGSFIKFVGGNVDRAALGNWGGFSIRYGASPYIMFDLNAEYGSFRPTLPDSKFKKDSDSPYQTFLFPINLEMKITSSKEGRIKPYGTFGVGLLMWDLRDVSGTDASFWGDQKLRWGTSVHGEIQKDLLLMVGLGTEIFLTNNIGLDLQGRLSPTPFADHKDNVGLGDNNDLALEARATLSFYFGAYKDTDKDGIEDKLDADPLHPEDLDGFQDNDGAPDYDNDADGIPDLNDKAPNEAEDKDGFQDDDGVPDRDNDGDGILDAKDKCPNKAEDVDGFQDEDGCPELDNDGDGISDAKDKCPDKPETVNGYQDDDGCPDKKPMLEKKGARLILKGINFASGSATLTEDSYETLDKVVAGLKDNREVAIEVRGYTDSRGSAKVNQKLSQRRAKTVMQYLIDAKIDPSRLKAVGYGEKDPVASNKTKEGRAQNRRIEFIRTK